MVKTSLLILCLAVAFIPSRIFGAFRNVHGEQCEHMDKEACHLFGHLLLDHVFQGRAYMPTEPSRTSHIPVKISFVELFTEKSLLRRSNATSLPEDVFEVVKKHRSILISTIGDMVEEYFAEPTYIHQRFSSKNETPHALTWRLKRIPNLSSTNYKMLLNPSWNRTLLTGPRAFERTLQSEKRRMGEVFRLDMEMKTLRNDVIDAVREMIKEGRLPNAVYPQQIDQVLERHFGSEKYRNSLWSRYSFLKYVLIKARPIFYLEGVLSLELDFNDYPIDALHPVFSIKKVTFIQSETRFREWDESQCRKLVLTQELYLCERQAWNETVSFPTFDGLRARIERSVLPSYKNVRRFSSNRYIATRNPEPSHDRNMILITSNLNDRPGQFIIDESLQKRLLKEDRDVYEFVVKSVGFQIRIVDPFPADPNVDDHTRIVLGFLGFVVLSMLLLLVCKIYQSIMSGSYETNEKKTQVPHAKQDFRILEVQIPLDTKTLPLRIKDTKY
uniref:Envelope protein n=1 Tax=Acrobeloides nanus TaxID=290746 RepID=A0A914CX64_9BILA